MVDKYQRWYDQIMERARSRQLDGYCERHHVIPRACGGGNEKENLVSLTYREHFLAHWLLVRFIKEEVHLRKMRHALWQMSRSPNGSRVVSSWQYDVAKLAYRNARVGHKTSLETKAKLSAALKGRKFSAERITNMSGRKHSAERKANISAAITGRKLSAVQITKMTGRKHSPEIRAKISAAMIGRTPSAETKAKISATSKGRVISSETRAKISTTKRQQSMING